MIEAKKTPLEQALEYVPVLKKELCNLSKAERDSIQEIRMRCGLSIVLEQGIKRTAIGISLNADELFELIKSFCGYSLHSYEKQLSEGFITLKGGHRAGFAGTAVINNGRVENIKDITSINLRIAKEYIGSADALVNLTGGGNSVLLIGSPMSAKTTLLRDYIRQLSEKYKITVIDERGELAAKSMGKISFDLGPNTDVLDGFPKDKGIMTAIRALSPDFVAIDEIGDLDITPCLYSGVRMLMTAHAGSISEAEKSPLISKIIESGAVSHIVHLGTGENIGKIKDYRNY